MKTHQMIMSALIVVLLNDKGFTQTLTSEIVLWHAGFMHPSEVKGKTGQLWFGLYETESGFDLRKTRITLLDSSDGLHDKFVAVSDHTLPICLVRGVEKMRIGPIKTVFWGNLHLDPEQFIVLDQKDGYFNGLSASGTRVGEVLHNYKMMFYDGKIKQYVFERDTAYSEGALSLIWSGDLDRDGKLDLIMDLSNHYNLSEPTLFLSSKAGSNELVKKVASFVRGGC